MARILLVDDHPLFREGFAHMVRVLRPTWKVHLAESGTRALALLAQIAFDLILVDIGLPDEDGFALVRAIAEQSVSVPIILISGRDDAIVHMRARASGVRSFVTKSQSPETIIDALEAVLAGKSTLEDVGSLPILTTRQTEVLMLLAEGHGNKEIRHRLDIAERTVRAHLTDLFQALGAHSRMQALIRAREMGLIP